nr:MarR family transcriptional regulator [Salinarchaeum laminariae]
MTKSDPAILELLEEAGIALPPAVIAYNIEGVSHPTVSRRLPILKEQDLVKKVEESKGYYAITDRGRAYLDGELDADELERDG